MRRTWLVDGKATNISFIVFLFLSVLAMKPCLADDEEMAPTMHPRNCYGDMLFIVETSEIIGGCGFLYIQKAVMDITKALHIGDNKDYVGLAHFSTNDSHSGVLFRPYPWSTLEAYDMVYGPKMDWSVRTIIGVANLKKGMELGVQMVNSAYERDQEPVYRFVILFAQGFYDQGGPPFEAAKHLREEKQAKIFAVEMPPRSSTQTLLDITQNTDHICKMGDHMLIAAKINHYLTMATCNHHRPTYQTAQP